MFKRKYKITILNEEWRRLYPDSVFLFLPRIDEYIFMTETNKYFKVLNVIHIPTKKYEAFIVVKEVENQNNTPN